MKRKKILAAAMILAAVCFGACNHKLDFPGAASPAPTTVSVESRVAALADADVTEEDGQLIIGIRVAEQDAAAACVQFFNEAEEIYAACVSGSDYTGVSFSLLRSGRVVASFFVLPRHRRHAGVSSRRERRRLRRRGDERVLRHAFAGVWGTEN
jgi:hypothetical protein